MSKMSVFFVRQNWFQLTILCLFLISFLNVAVYSATIVTFAGGGPDDIPAILANLQEPKGVVAGHFGNYYVSAGNRIYEINRNSNPPMIKAIAGTGFAGYSGDNGPALKATLNEPGALALDGNFLYFVQTSNFVVRRINLNTKIIETFAGNGNSGLPDSRLLRNQTSLMHPVGLAVSLRHVVYIADSSANRVFAVADDHINFFAGVGLPTNPQTGGIGDGGDPKIAGLSVSGVAVTGMVTDTVYISDPVNKRIRIVTVNTNKINTYAGSSPSGSFPGPAIPISADSITLVNPFGLAVTPSNELFVTDSEKVIWKINSNRTAFVADQAPRKPNSVTVNPNGEIFFASFEDNKIYSLNPVTFIKTAVAGNGLKTFNKVSEPLTAVSFLNPTDLVYRSNVLYVADKDNYIVRAIDLPNNSISDVVGDNTDSGVNSVGPVTGMAIDSLGNLYLAASTDHIVFRVPLSGGLISFAGRRKIPDNHGVFNGFAPFGSITSPFGVAVDKDNNVFIAQTGDMVIRKVSYSDGSLIFASGFYNSGFYGSPRGLAFPPSPNPNNQDNRIFVNDGTQIKYFIGFERPTVFAGRGPAGFSGNGGLAKDALFDDINAMIFDGRGGILLSDTNNNQVRRIDLSTNRVEVFAGNGVQGFSGDGGDARTAQLNHPLGLAIDGAGNVYISDSGNNRIRKVIP